MIRGGLRRDSVDTPRAHHPPRECAMLVVGMRLDGPRESRTAITEERGELRAERVRDLIVCGERVTEVRNAQRTRRGLRALRLQGRHEAVERLRVFECRRWNFLRRLAQRIG